MAEVSAPAPRERFLCCSLRYRLRICCGLDSSARVCERLTKVRCSGNVLPYTSSSHTDHVVVPDSPALPIARGTHGMISVLHCTMRYGLALESGAAPFLRMFFGFSTRASSSKRCHPLAPPNHRLLSSVISDPAEGLPCLSTNLLSSRY